jgi:nucleoside-diphosphate-sugar epimerase
MKVLFIGGTGIISASCSRLAVEMGIELAHFNRGRSHRRVDGVKRIQGDIHDRDGARELLRGQSFDAVVNWIAFRPEQVRADIELFRGQIGQYVFISSASAYQKPVRRLPITEQTPLENPFWQYARDKARCEVILGEEYRERGFPLTIVRPSHTYDATLLPTDWGYTVLDIMKKGKKIIIPGDGTSVWVMTHASDFAAGFVPLLGNQRAIGEAFHITSDELLTWNLIYQMMAEALGVSLNALHIPSDFIARHDPEMGANLLGDKSHSVIFDNSKIRGLVPGFAPGIPFQRGVREIVQWYEQNAGWQVVDQRIDSTIDAIIDAYGVSVG